MIPILITAPTAHVVETAALKVALAVDHAHHDALIEGYRAGAVAHLDGWRGVLGRAIMPQTWAQDFTGWGDLRLALPDVTSHTVTGYDEAGLEVVPTRNVLSLDYGGPVVATEGPAVVRVRVQYDCALPVDQRPAVASIVTMLVASWYENREAVVTGMSVATLPMAAEALIEALRWRSV
jgi:hypothetical protein